MVTQMFPDEEGLDPGYMVRGCLSCMRKPPRYRLTVHEKTAGWESTSFYWCGSKDCYEVIRKAHRDVYRYYTGEETAWYRNVESKTIRKSR